MTRSRSAITSRAQPPGTAAGVALLAAALVLCAAQPAAADPLADARRHFRQAERQYAAGHYEAALTEYSTAYELSQLPGFLFNIGACHHELGHWAEAKDSLARYIEAVPDAANRADAERLLQEATEHLPPPEPVAEPEPPPPEPPPIAPPPPPPRSRTIHPLGLVLLGGGAALAVAATLFAADLGSTQSSLDDRSLDCTLRTARCHDLRDRGNRDAALQLVLGGAAVAALAAAGVLLTLDLLSPSDSADSAQVTIGPGQLGLRGTF